MSWDDQRIKKEIDRIVKEYEHGCNVVDISDGPCFSCDTMREQLWRIPGYYDYINNLRKDI